MEEKKIARKYTRDFKVEVCKLIIEDNIKLQVVADKFSLNQVMVYRWVDEYKTYGNDAFVGKGKLRPEDARLKKLQQENEILKKAAAYFAKAKGQD